MGSPLLFSSLFARCVVVLSVVDSHLTYGFLRIRKDTQASPQATYRTVRLSHDRKVIYRIAARQYIAGASRCAPAQHSRKKVSRV